MFMIWKIQHTKMSILPEMIHKFNAMPIKITAIYFIDIKKAYFKISRGRHRP